MHNQTFNRTFLIVGVLAVIAILKPACGQGGIGYEDHATNGEVNTAVGSVSATLASDDPWSQSEVVRPGDLAKMLAGERKPIVLCVGVIHLFRIGHIPGSKFGGQAGSAEGLDALKKEAQVYPRDSELVYYCGCCPWNDCPNIRPAYKLLREMGFKKVRVLYLPNSFTQDWTKEGLATEKGGA